MVPAPTFRCRFLGLTSPADPVGHPLSRHSGHEHHIAGRWQVVLLTGAAAFCTPHGNRVFAEPVAESTEPRPQSPSKGPLCMGSGWVVSQHRPRKVAQSASGCPPALSLLPLGLLLPWTFFLRPGMTLSLPGSRAAAEQRLLSRNDRPCPAGLLSPAGRCLWVLQAPGTHAVSFLRSFSQQPTRDAQLLSHFTEWETGSEPSWGDQPEERRAGSRTPSP